jgi:hypothetical protein
MKKSSLALIAGLFTMNTAIMGQAKDSIPVKKVVEKGAKGDVILRKQNQKKQLSAPPQLLEHKDSLHNASTQKNKKSKSKGRKEGK